MFPIRTPVLKIEQPLGEFYVAVLPATTLLGITFSDPLKILGVTSSGEYELKGHQRKLVQDRLKAIGRYIDTVEAAFPNSIILAANYREDGTLEEKESLRWRVENTDDERIGTLVIPSSEKLAAIVDGQHRLYGFKNSSIASRLQMPLLCAIYLDLPNPFQAYLFATINYNQKPVDKSQSYELYGFNLEEEDSNAWSPEKTAVFLTRKLNTDENSPFKDHIIVAAQDDRNVGSTSRSKEKGWAISTATIVEGLLRLFSSNPKRDRDSMHSKEIGKGRQRNILAQIKDNSPLRQYYIDGNDLLIYTMTVNYFKAINDILWQENGHSFIRKTVGIQALFDVLRVICIASLKNKNISQQYFLELLDPARLLNFNDAFFEASGRGRLRIRNALELKLGLKKIEEIDDRDRPVYKAICNFD